MSAVRAVAVSRDLAIDYLVSDFDLLSEQIPGELCNVTSRSDRGLSALRHVQTFCEK